jgi:hypothetical protein
MRAALLEDPEGLRFGTQFDAYEQQNFRAGTIVGATNARPRSGLRIIGRRGHPEVREAFIRYAVWLRHEMDFSIRVPVYLLPTPTIKILDGTRVSASILLPWDREIEPYIQVATGDYPSVRSQWGRDTALGSWLMSLSHECIHYRQWVETGQSWERGVAVRARHMVLRYARTVDHP